MRACVFVCVCKYINGVTYCGFFKCSLQNSVTSKTLREEGRVRLHTQQGLGSFTLSSLKPGYSRDPKVQQRESATHVHEGPRHDSKAVGGDTRSVLDLI